MSELSTSSSNHQEIMDQLSPLALGLPSDAVRAPMMPVDTYITEIQDMIDAAHEERDVLLAAGMDWIVVTRLAQRTEALEGAQAALRKYRNKGRSEATLALIDAATALRADTLAMADLALRNNNDGRRRLGLIREGEGLPDLVADLLDLSLLLQDGAELFVAVKIDPAPLATQLNDMHKDLTQALAAEDGRKTLSMEADLRDRYYTLTLDPVRELRAFAQFAFRKDRKNTRRYQFTSNYLRTRNRRTRAKQAWQASQAISDGNDIQ